MIFCSKPVTDKGDTVSADDECTVCAVVPARQHHAVGRAVRHGAGGHIHAAVCVGRQR